MNLPTWITISRLFGLPFIVYFLSNPTTNHRWFALIIFLLASLTDWLDGYLARKLNQVTDLGKFLDPLVDKLLVFGPFLMLVELQEIPAWGVFLILARELAIAGWRVNPSQTTIVGANIWGKLKTVTQIGAIALLIPPFPELYYPWGILTFWLAVALTLISGIIYIWPNSSSQIA